MRRVSLGLACALALGAAPSSATSVGPLSVPPFERIGGTGGIASATPCAVSSHTNTVSPDAATGRIDAAVSVSVQGCVNFGFFASDTWKIADVPANLVGQRGTVVVYILVDGVQASQSGGGNRGAVHKVRIADNEKILHSVECVDEGCHHPTNTIGPLMMPIGVAYSQLPTQINMTIWRDAYVYSSSGTPVTGSAGIDVRAAVKAVLIHTL